MYLFASKGRVIFDSLRGVSMQYEADSGMHSNAVNASKLGQK